ncbi:MAG: T9SS type A sorting domain-containing protein [Flavobacteriaceae bacterium]
MKESTSQTNFLVVDDLSSGLYIIRVYKENIYTTHKLIIQ